MEGIWGPVIVGLISLVGTLISALVLHNRNKAVLDIRIDHLTEKFDDIRKDVKCVEDKVDENIVETGKIKGKVIALEKDVEMLKGKGVKYANH